jgi:hypothetical protein
MEFSPALTYDNAAGLDSLTAVNFDPQHLRVAVATVSAARLTFLMCHDIASLFKIIYYSN